MQNTHVYINKISSFLPNSPVNNDEMESILGQVGPRPSRARKLVLRNNKIQQRYYAIDPNTLEPNYTCAQLAAAAIKKLEGDSFTCSDITCLSAATTLPDQLMPNHAVMVHGELNCPPCEVVSTAGICVCGMSALKYAYLSVLSGEHTQAIASASESVSSSMRAHNFSQEIEERVAQLEKRPEIAFEKDFLRWMLSDGSGAMLLSNTPNTESPSLKIDWIELFSYANEQPACMYAGAIKEENGTLKSWRLSPASNRDDQGYLNIKQDVKQLNEHVLTYTVEKPLASIIEKRGITPEDYTYFVPHYSSGYFKDKVADSLAAIEFVIPQEKWFTNLYSKGNTGSASIYIMLEELFNTKNLKKGEKILCYIPESGRFSTSFMQLTVV